MATLLALLSSVLWGTSDFLGGTATRRLPAVGVVAGSEAFGLVGVLVAAVLTRAYTASPGYVGWSLLAAVAGMAGIVAFYNALATGTMGVVAPIAALGVVVPVAVGIVHGDRPGRLQDVGVLVAVVGVVLASGPELNVPGRSRAAGARPLLLAGMAAVGFGVVFVCLDRGARSSTIMSLVAMRAASLVLLLGVVATGRVSMRVAVRDLPLLAVIGGLDVAANATFAVATQHGLLSIVSVLSSLYPAITVMLARGVHSERLARVQLVGVSGALVGVALIASGGAA